MKATLGAWKDNLWRSGWKVEEKEHLPGKDCHYSSPTGPVEHWTERSLCESASAFWICFKVMCLQLGPVWPLGFASWVYFFTLASVVACRHYSWVELWLLFSLGMLHRIFGYYETCSSGRRLPGQFELFSFQALCLKCMVSLATLLVSMKRIYLLHFYILY